MHTGHRLRLSRGISLLATGLFACACGAGAPPARSVPENALRAPAPRFVGRFDFSDPAGPRLSWSGSTIEARFAGSGIAMRLRVPPPPPAHAGDPPLYTVRVDDRLPQPLAVAPGDNRYVLAEHLDPRRPHLVVVTRESEAFAGVHQLLGLELVPGGELLAPAPERIGRPRIEVIGDSITCGYGVLGHGADCRFSFATERATAAYPALAGRALGADVTTLCWSGRGVYRNYDEADQPTMPELWEPAKTAPAAVVVSLGTNDVLAEREPFDARELERAYEAFLARIRQAYPDAWIVVTVSPMLEGDRRSAAAASIERVVASRRSGGDARVEVLAFAEQRGRVGCDSHPNEVMQKMLAAQLERTLRPKLPPGGGMLDSAK